MPLKDFTIEIDRDGRTKLEIAEGGSATGQFDFNPENRIQGVIRDIEEGSCDIENLKDVGVQLYSGLFSPDLARAFDQARDQLLARNQRVSLRLLIPPDLWSLPWESLYDEGANAFLAANPNYSLVRDTLEKTDKRPNIAARNFPLRVLVAIPQGSGLNVEREWSNLKQAFADSENRKQVILELLEGQVTPDRLEARLRKPVDILHYIGHGEMNRANAFNIRLNDGSSDGAFWADAEAFTSLFYRIKPHLVVLNCCMGADVEKSPRGLSGIGAYLMKAGVPATIAMRYEVPDSVAIRFTDVFYRELFGGDEPGNIESALARARHSLFLNKRDGTIRGFITPVLYLLTGAEQLFAPGDQEPPPPPPPPPRVAALPAELVALLKRGECIPIVGPEILKLGVVRGGSPIPDPADLVERLAVEGDYPLQLEAATLQGMQAKASFLPSLCQYMKRHVVIRVLQDVYQNAQPPPEFLSLAAMNVPAIVYMYFDQLLERALAQMKKPVQTVTAIDRSFDPDPKATLLVYLRGTLQDFDSLVLTEDDYESLWDQIGTMCLGVRNLMKGRAGRSALILGVSPRDPLLKRFLARMLDAGSRRSQGPTFFVCTNHTQADDAYWAKYDVRWIPLDLDAFADGLRGVVP